MFTAPSWVNGSKAEIAGVPIDSTQNASFYAETQEFPTNGCKKVIIRISNFNISYDYNVCIGSISVNNNPAVKFSSSGGASYIFDISEETFKIKLMNIGVWGYNGNPYVKFHTISVE